MAVLTHFRSARRILGVLPMPDGARRAFKGCNMAQVLRQWQHALGGRSMREPDREIVDRIRRSPCKDGRRQ